jgi:hypothetical protein
VQKFVGCIQFLKIHGTKMYVVGRRERIEGEERERRKGEGGDEREGRILWVRSLKEFLETKIY